MSVNGSTPSRVHVLDGNKSNSLLYRHEGAVACSRGEKTGPPRHRRVRGPGDLGEEVMGEPWTPPGYGTGHRGAWVSALPPSLLTCPATKGMRQGAPSPDLVAYLPSQRASPAPGQARPVPFSPQNTATLSSVSVQGPRLSRSPWHLQLSTCLAVTAPQGPAEWNRYNHNTHSWELNYQEEGKTETSTPSPGSELARAFPPELLTGRCPSPAGTSHPQCQMPAGQVLNP